MTVSAADLTRYRETIHRTNLGLVVYVPPTIWTAQINGSPSKGALTLPVDNVVQTRAPAKNYQVLFGSTSGESDLGEARFISYSAPNLVVSENNSTLPNNAYVTVKEVVQPSAIHVDIDDATDEIFEDGNVNYVDENEDYMPLARCGTHAFAYRDPTTGLATLKFYSRSTAIAAGATLSSCLWTWRGGTVTVGSTATFGTAGVPNVVTWDTSGDYYCSFKVTDSNGKEHTRYFVVFIRDKVTGTTPYTQVEISGPQNDLNGVATASVQVYTSATEDEFPSQGLVVIAADDLFGDENVSIGNELYRENIVYAGYIKSGTCKKNWSSGYVEFELESLSGAMGNMAALAGWLERTAGTPAGWHELKNMTFNLAAHHLLTQHSTVSQLTDVYLNLPSYGCEYIDLPEGSQWNQLTSFIGAVRGQAGCNFQGHLYLEVDPQLQVVGDRSVAYVLSTDLKDFRDDIDFGEEPSGYAVSRIDFQGEDAAGNLLFSIAPLVHWPSGLPEKIEGVYVVSQAEANDFAGCFEGERNNPYRNVVIQWRGNYRCWDIFPRLPLQVTAASNKRGIDWSNQRCWTTSVSMEYRPGILLVSSVVERDAAFTSGSGISEGETPPADDTPPATLPALPVPPPYNPYGPPVLPRTEPLLWSDGWVGAAVSGTPYLGMYGLTPCAFMMLQVQVTAVQTELTFYLYLGYANADLEIIHNADNTWTWNRYNGSTGALISTHSVAAGTTCTATLTGADVITVPAAGMEMKTELLVSGATSTVPYRMLGQVS